MKRDLLIYFDEEWLHQRYYGWRVVVATNTTVILVKERGPLHRVFVMTLDSDRHRLVEMIERIRLPKQRTNFIVHDFSGDSGGELELFGLTPVRSTESTLLVYDKTVILDLGKAEQQLWAEMVPDYRNLCRRAEADGVRVSLARSDAEAAIDTFSRDYAVFSAERGLVDPPLRLLRDMSRRGNLRVYHTTDAMGERYCTTLVYVTPRRALYLYGINHRRSKNGAGQYTQWKIVEELKRQGFVSYDLAGFPRDENDRGIYLFKSRFCREVFDLGAEWHYQGAYYRLASVAWNRMRNATRRRTAAR